MPDCNKASGVDVKVALKKAAAWGTPVAAGAGDGILVQPPTLNREQERLPDNSIGLHFTQSSDRGNIKTEGDIPMFPRYDGIDLLIALVMGSTGGGPVQQDATTAYAQSFIMTDDICDLFATVVEQLNTMIKEYPSVKLSGFVIKGDVGQPIEIAFTCMADDMNPASAVNTGVTFANVTFPESANRLLFGQCVFRLNEASDIALASPAADISPSSFEITFKRNLQGVYKAGADNKIDEPTNNGKDELTLKLDFPRLTSNSYYVSDSTDELMKMDMVFTGGVIEAPYNRLFTISFPNLALKKVDGQIEEGIIKQPLEFDIQAAAAAPLGMTGITKPFQIDVINQETADVLA